MLLMNFTDPVEQLPDLGVLTLLGVVVTFFHRQQLPGEFILQIEQILGRQLQGTPSFRVALVSLFEGTGDPIRLRSKNRFHTEKTGGEFPRLRRSIFIGMMDPGRLAAQAPLPQGDADRRQD